MTNPKQKGKAFEKKIAKVLGKWMFADEFALYASTGSGNRSTALRKQGRKDIHPGDIHPVKLGIKLPCAVECKKVEKFFLDQYFNKKSPISQAIDKIRKEAKSHDLPWMLIYSRNREEPTVLVSKECLSFMKMRKEAPKKRILTGLGFWIMSLSRLVSDFEYHNR